MKNNKITIRRISIIFLLTFILFNGCTSSKPGPPEQIDFKVIWSNTVELTWNNVKNADRYFLYRSSSKNGPFKEIEKGAAVIYYKSKWPETNIHYDAGDGWTSMPGKPMTKVAAGEYKGWFTYSFITGDNTRICFNYKGKKWDSKNYKNYRINQPGIYTLEYNSSIKKIGDNPNTGFTNCRYKDITYSINKTYYYKIQSSGELGKSEFSKIFSFTMPAPEKSKIPYLTWSSSNQYFSGLVVNYLTRKKTIGKVNYGKNKKMDKTAIENRTDSIHHVSLNGLDENTRYYYQVIYEDNIKSDVYYFTTGKRNANKFSFAVMADMQDGGNKSNPSRRWEDVADAVSEINRKKRINFLIIPGDMPANDYPEYWKIFFDKGRKLFPYKVIMPAVGNHDTHGDTNHVYYSPNPYGTKDFDSYFKLPDNKNYYSFNYGIASFIALNTEIIADIKSFKDSSQYPWLKHNFKKLQKLWIFAYSHIPPYSVVKRHLEDTLRVRPAADIFHGNIDWFFAGHIHSYQRFKPLIYKDRIMKRYGRKDGEGCGYIVLPPAGNYPESYENRHNPLLEYPLLKDIKNGAKSEDGFTIVDIDGRSIRITTYGLGDLYEKRKLHIIDTVNYMKQ